MRSLAAERQAIHERRQRVAALRLAGVRDCRSLAARIGVGKSTIGRDLQALDAEYRSQAAAEIATEKGLDLARCDRLLQVVWPDAISGSLPAIDRVLAILRYRAKVLGLDGPTLIDITDDVRAMAAELGLDPEEAIAIADAYVRQLPRR